MPTGIQGDRPSQPGHPKDRGTRIIADRYEIVDTLGGGEVTEVFKVRELATGRVLALKTLKSGAPHDEALSLNREFYHLSRFNHANVVKVVDFGKETDGRRFFTMEYFPGEPFNVFFKGGFSERLIPALFQALQALETIHLQGLCHCDVKPQNLLVANGDQGQPVAVKLLDFGFAEKVTLPERESRGTLGYIAPEVFKGTGIDARADIYSLGMVVYEALTGKGPASAPDIMAWLREQYGGKLPRPKELGTTVPDALEEVIWSMIQREPDSRPRTCLEVMEKLSALSGIPVAQAQREETPQNYLLTTGFVGRNEQLVKLDELLKTAAAGQGNVAFISGERGIGKSRLQSEFKFLAQLQGATVFRFTPASLGARPQSLLESAIGFLKDFHGIDISDELGLGRERAAEVREQNAGIGPDDNAGEAAKYRLFETVTDGLRRLARSEKVGQSLVLLVDDFELFDPTSLEFLRYLMSSVDKDRVMILVCGLNERRLLDLIKGYKARGTVSHFPIVPLTPSETRDLTASVLGRVPQLDDLVAWIQESTGGNPLFITETIYSLIDRGILHLKQSRWSVKLDELRSYRIPETVSEVIKRRLRRLAQDEMEVLRVGAVSGSPLTIEFLHEVLGYSEAQLFNAVGKLKSQGLMRPYAGDGFSSLILSSKMLESVVIETVTVAERRDTHRRVAVALEKLYPDELSRRVFDLAHHYTQAGIREKAYPYAVQAGDRAFRFHLTEQALTYYEIAQGMAGPDLPTEDKLDLFERIGELREILGRYREAVDCYMQGISIVVADKSLSKSSDRMPRFLRNIGLVSQKQGKHGEAIQYFEQAAAMLKGRLDVLSVNLLNDQGWSHCAQGNYSRADRFYSQALQLGERLSSLGTARGADDPLVRAQYYRAVLEWYQGNTDAALNLVQPAIEACEAREAGMVRGRLGHLTQFAAMLHWSKGDAAEALLRYEKCLPLQRRSNDVFYLLRTLNGIAMVRIDAGQWEDARTDLEEALRIAERLEVRAEAISILNNLAALQEEMGEWAAARASYSQSQKLAVEEGDQAALCATLGNLAALADLRGDFDDAERLLKDALSMATKLEQRPLEQALLVSAARLELRRDRLGVAKSHLLRAFRLNRADNDRRQRPALQVVAADLHLRSSEPGKARFVLKPLKADDRPQAKVPGKYRLRAMNLEGLALVQLNQLPEARKTLDAAVRLARSLKMPFELGLTLLNQANVRTTVNQPESLIRNKPGLALSDLSAKDISESLAALKEARELFQKLGAKFELQRTEELTDRISQLEASKDMGPRPRSEYLRVYFELSDIIRQGLEQDDFMERILDLVIEVTGAERGLLFLVQGDKLVSVAARAIDHTTLQDAQNISRTLLRQVRRKAEPLMTADALTDPRFSNSNSVTLNKIRSMLCVPLVMADRVIGAIYVDSRLNAHLFWDEDRMLLMSISNLLAATIDKSLAFRRIQEGVGIFRDDILTDAATGFFLGKSKAMRDVYQLIEKIAPTDCTVLLLGETGSGKGVLARLIHTTSRRKDKPLVSINCGTLPETLFESELFGYAKGAFTDARRDKEGLIETAEGGTVFLDEISNTTIGSQAKLLQAIEEKVIRRVGETETRQVDIRLICATNRDLIEDVKAQKFREDLYYRLNVVTITVPPLRDRVADIPQLAGYFLRRYAKETNKVLLGFEEEALKVLSRYPWPGNVRELQNVIERAAIMSQKRKITAADLGLRLSQEPQLIGVEANADLPRTQTMSRVDLVKALIECRGNVSETAKRLNTHRRQVQRLLKRYEIDKNHPQ